MVWLITAVLLVAAQSPSPETLSSKSIFVIDNLHWRTQPGKLKDYSYRSASGTLLIFRADGEFDRLEGTLVREQQDGPISINYRRGYRLSVGTWKRISDDEIHVTSRVIFVTIPTVGEAIPGPDVQSSWNVHGQAKGRIAAAIEGGGRRYVPVYSISGSETRALDQVIRLHSKEVSHPNANGEKSEGRNPSVQPFHSAPNQGHSVRRSSRLSGQLQRRFSGTNFQNLAPGRRADGLFGRGNSGNSYPQNSGEKKYLLNAWRKNS